MVERNVTQPTVLVVGGGYGGIRVAKSLDDVAGVTLVEPKDAFVHNVAALRALVDPAMLPRIFFPYDRLLTRGRVVHDRVAQFDGERALLGSGAQISADFVVLATGSRYPFPAKTDVHLTDHAFDEYRTAHAALVAARRVLIIGAGPVGLELAGEIVSAWPDKQVTITDVAADILAGPFKQELRDELRRQLTERGVELRLGSAFRGDPPSPSGVRETFTIASQTGVELTADVWFRAYGVMPVTDYLTGDIAAARTSDGYVTITPQLQVPGFDRVFAIGDIAADHANMAALAGRQAEVVANNIRTHISGSGEIRSFEGVPPAIMIPLGPEGGAAQLPDRAEIAGPEFVAERKGRAMMVDRYAELFGLLEPSASKGR
jgi:NADH dehydrogenase FAD-containing subunit